MRHPPESVDPVQLGAYFALIEVTSLLRHAIEQPAVIVAVERGVDMVDRQGADEPLVEDQRAHQC